MVLEKMIISFDTLLIIYAIITNSYWIISVLWIQKKEDPDNFWLLKYLFLMNLYWLIIPIILIFFIGNLN